MSDVQQVRERIQLVRGLSNEMAAYMHTLPDNIWRDPDVYASACEGWKIADVITHLILGANVFGLSITNAVKGIVEPPMGWTRPASPEQGMERLVDTRNAIHEDLFYDFNASCKRFNTIMLELDESSYSLPTWHPYFVISVDRLIDIRASELALHFWDIRYPIDRSAKLSARAVPFLLDFVWRWLRTGFQQREPLDKADTLSLRPHRRGWRLRCNRAWRQLQACAVRRLACQCYIRLRHRYLHPVLLRQAQPQPLGSAWTHRAVRR